MHAYSSLADEFYSNMNLSTEMPLPNNRETVLGFLEPPGAGVGGVPRQTLFAFQRVFVKAGETVTVHLYPSLTDLTHVTLAVRRSRP